MQSTKTIDVVSDETLGNIIKINNIIFRGRQNIDWKMVEIYLQKYIGMVVELSDEIIYIDTEEKFNDIKQNIRDLSIRENSGEAWQKQRRMQHRELLKC